jgi:methionyl-tRNA synthetase
MAYITTPIYYVNDDPHIGHIYTTVCADVLCRFERLIGNPVFFLTGTDEHATKVEEAANKRNIKTEVWVESKAAVFKQAFNHFGIEATDFIRTTEARHTEQVIRRFEELLVSGDIYLSTYEGWYDTGQEEYVAETKARETNFLSSINKKPLVRRSEPCFYFRLSAYAAELQTIIENDELKIRPIVRKQEILARIRDGINDVPCSRPRTGNWGVAVPGHPDQTVYVWIDALLNYLTAVDTEDRRQFWPPSTQIVGKDILWFHAVIWPSMLLALKKTARNHWIKLPNTIRAHSFWIHDGEKMSKSMGNFITLAELEIYAQRYGQDALRFFLVLAGPNDASDANFSADRLHESYTSFLANTLGNCCSRVMTMIIKYCGAIIPANEVNSGFPIDDAKIAVAKARDFAVKAEYSSYIEEALKIVRYTDAFIYSSEPFKLAKDPAHQKEVCSILHDSLEALRLASTLLWPVMPKHIEEFWSAIGCKANFSLLIAGGSASSDDWMTWGGLPVGAKIEKMPPLFPRIELPSAAKASNE